MGVVDDLERARDAFERREWVAAYGALSDVGTESLTGDDFARLAMTAYLLGHRNDCVQALQRAYEGYVAAGQTLEAVRSSYWLAMTLLENGEFAVGGGWAARCHRLLADVPGEVVERGYARNLDMMRHIFSGEFDAAWDAAAEVAEFGRRFEDPDLLANGLNAQGRLLLYSGRVPEGLALLDEAMVGIATGQVSPIFAGHVYCSLIEACQEICDYGRMTEWTEALTRWTAAQPGLVPFVGQCAVHRGRIMRMHGAFDEALRELEQALARYREAGELRPAGLAMSEAGDVHRLLGDYDAAAAAYEQAKGFGHEPQPGLALLWLARGRTAAAQQAVARLLAEPRDPVNRSQLLPGAVEVLLGVAEVEQAASVADELASVAESFGCTALRAMSLQASAGCRVAGGDAGAAVPLLRKALRLWRSLDAPYDVARCQVLMATAMRTLGDEESAFSELGQARRTFHDLGAKRDERDTAQLLAPSRPAGLTERELEVLRLVANGKSNSEIAAVLVLSEKTVARHLSNIFTKLDVTSRTAAAAFAFENNLL